MFSKRKECAAKHTEGNQKKKKALHFSDHSMRTARLQYPNLTRMQQENKLINKHFSKRNMGNPKSSANIYKSDPELTKRDTVS